MHTVEHRSHHKISILFCSTLHKCSQRRHNEFLSDATLALFARIVPTVLPLLQRVRWLRRNCCCLLLASQRISIFLLPGSPAAFPWIHHRHTRHLDTDSHTHSSREAWGVIARFSVEGTKQSGVQGRTPFFVSLACFFSASLKQSVRVSSKSFHPVEKTFGDFSAGKLRKQVGQGAHLFSISRNLFRTVFSGSLLCVGGHLPGEQSPAPSCSSRALVPLPLVKGGPWLSTPRLGLLAPVRPRTAITVLPTFPSVHLVEGVLFAPAASQVGPCRETLRSRL